ncbi:FAD-dependent oxidoreductase [Pseudonocardia kongjuensis]|uniref:FAD-dependent oxidoreductase n=1 Tax=Pseudonocardia kongjuensis TaxID=102227 RepID=A0ABP4IBC9_9PSEU
MQTIVIVGAALAGTRAAEALRDEGFEGRVLLVGDEPGNPYDRPPLSKQYLGGEWPAEQLDLLSADDLDDLEIERLAGVAATGLDVAGHRLRLADGTGLGYDGLVIATGARPRTAPELAPGTPGVHVLRTLADSAGLAAALLPGRRLGVIGGGFIGCEVASVATGAGVEVTVFERAGVVMGQVLGERIGRRLQALQESRGVRVRTGVAVERITRGPGGLVVHGADTVVDDVLISIGAVPNVEWLDGSGLPVDGGLLCDPALFAADDVVVAGDVARLTDADGRPRRRVEHWTHAALQGETAAANLLAGRAAATPFRAVPYVWSDQYEVRVEILGEPGPADDVEPVLGDDGTAPCLYVHRRAGQPVALVGIDAQEMVLRARRELDAAGGWDASLIDRIVTPAGSAP